MTGHEIIETYIPYEYREAFIRNMYDKDYLEMDWRGKENIGSFIRGSFNWYSTPEGIQYWSVLVDIGDRLEVVSKYSMMKHKFV